VKEDEKEKEEPPEDAADGDADAFGGVVIAADAEEQKPPVVVAEEEHGQDRPVVAETPNSKAVNDQLMEAPTRTPMALMAHARALGATPKTNREAIEELVAHMIAQKEVNRAADKRAAELEQVKAAVKALQAANKTLQEQREVDRKRIAELEGQRDGDDGRAPSSKKRESLGLRTTRSLPYQERNKSMVVRLAASSNSANRCRTKETPNMIHRNSTVQCSSRSHYEVLALGLLSGGARHSRYVSGLGTGRSTVRAPNGPTAAFSRSRTSGVQPDRPPYLFSRHHILRRRVAR
jgi:hypothetical protein